MKNLSLILPVLNERENLKILIPDFINMLEKNFEKEYQILVIDDNSTDGSLDLFKTLQKENKNFTFKIRENDRSLPRSILEGINLAKYENIMWLDADGSMGVEDAEKLIRIKKKYKYKNLIGSRFVTGGGYKGFNKNDNVIKTMSKLKNSEDSIVATYLSIFFNFLLKKITKSKVYDLTSGFILTEKKYVNFDYLFQDCVYGEYFINLVMKLEKENIEIIEIPYFCKTRIYGISKTSYSFFRILKLSLPYIKTAFTFRR